MLTADVNRERLAGQRARLDASDATLMQAIGTWETKLAELGIEHWLEEEWITRGATRLADEDDVDQRLWFEAWNLGVARLDGRWRVAVREVVVRIGTEYAHGFERVVNEVFEDRRVALADAPLTVRIRAAEQVPVLVSDLEALLHQLAHQVDDALTVLER